MDVMELGEDGFPRSAPSEARGVDLGGGFVIHREPGREPIVVATALAETGALGFASPPDVDGRLDADALTWLTRACLLRGRRLCSLSQVHGAMCISAAETNGPTRELAEADAVWTSSPDDLLVIRTADCAALWLVDREKQQLAMVHAGWRGAAEGIIKQTVDTLRGQGGRPETMVAAIGPHIGPCCFEVGPEVGAHFAGIDGAVAPAYALTAPRQRADSVSLNLGAILTALLQDAGVARDSIHRATACTRCFRAGDGEHVLHSYRRKGRGGPLTASVGFLGR